MGMITGSVGSVIRDILINEEPLIFRKDIYAMACVVGGVGIEKSISFGFPIWVVLLYGWVWIW